LIRLQKKWPSCTVKVLAIDFAHQCKAQSHYRVPAGKGRSGTLACAYILSLGPKQLERCCDLEIWTLVQADLTTEVVSEEPLADPRSKMERMESTILDISPNKEDKSISGSPRADTVQRVLDLHTARRMKLSDQCTKPGISIPSQRRWLHYWSLHLRNRMPPNSGAFSFLPLLGSVEGCTRNVRLTQIKLRTEEITWVKTILAKAAGRASRRGRIPSPTLGQLSYMSVSLARYDDKLVDLLQDCEKQTGNHPGDPIIPPPSDVYFLEGRNICVPTSAGRRRLG